MRLIRSRPDDRVQREELLRACRSDLRYDSQCEDSRAPYLYRLLCATADPQACLDELSALIDDNRDAGEDFAPVQIFEILCLAAKDGDKIDHAWLRRVAARADFDEWGFSALLALVELDGTDALTFAAEHRQEAIAQHIREGDAWVVDAFLHRLEERDGAEAAVANVAAARATSPELDALLTLKESAPPSLVTPKPADLDYDTVRQMMLADGGHPPARWSDSASDADILRAANDLVQETDDKRILTYLRMFWRRPFPLAPSALFPLLRHANHRIPWTAARVLGQIRNRQVRALALERLGDNDSRAIALKLLYDNFEPGDIQRLETFLASSPPSPDEWEHLAGPVFALFDKNSLPAEDIRPLLLKFYENLPCSLCRRTAIKKLIATGGAPDGIAEECRSDADSRMRALFPLCEAA